MYGYMTSDVWFCFFNDALNTFYSRLHGVSHIVKDHSNSERGNQLPPHGLLFPISSKGLYASSTDKITHITAFVIQVVGHWLEQEIPSSIPLT